jgi:hypothetical protein
MVAGSWCKRGATCTAVEFLTSGFYWEFKDAHRKKLSGRDLYRMLLGSGIASAQLLLTQFSGFFISIRTRLTVIFVVLILTLAALT